MIVETVNVPNVTATGARVAIVSAPRAAVTGANAPGAIAPTERCPGDFFF